MQRRKILCVIGTRPEAIKMAPVIRYLLDDKRFAVRLCITGQHTDLMADVLDIFEIQPDHDLSILQDGTGLVHIASAVMKRLDLILQQNRPDWVVVHGDTNSAAAATLAAFYSGIPVAHVEAGLRTYNLEAPWPEEANRQVIGRLATLHFAPTERAKANLLSEGMREEQVCLTGNTVVDSIAHYVRLFAEDVDLAAKLAVQFSFRDEKKKLLLVTGHRRENQDFGLSRLCEVLVKLARRPDIQIAFPVHPNPVVQEIVHAKLGNRKNIFLLEPLSYPPFLWLLSQAHLVVTDSGGIQEEAPSFGVPVLVTREDTERQEALATGAIRLVGTFAADLEHVISDVLDTPRLPEAEAVHRNPFGDGQAAARIADALATYAPTMADKGWTLFG